MHIPSDSRAAINNLKPAFILPGKVCVHTPLIKHLIEVVLGVEIDQHLAHCSIANRKNGKARKVVKTAHDAFELYAPRDRANSFEPQFVKKHQIHLTRETEIKIISMFCVGMSREAIRLQLADIYGSGLSCVGIAAITEKVILEVKQFQQRKLDSHYSLIWLDVIRCKMREEGVCVNKTIYTLLALNANGEQVVLGFYLSRFENAHFWLSVLRDLQRRGVKNIVLAALEGFTGFPAAISSIFPNARVCSALVNVTRNAIPALNELWSEGAHTGNNRVGYAQLDAITQ